MTAATLRRTRVEVAAGARAARAALGPWAAAPVVLFVLAALLPLATPSWIDLEGLAATLYLALAATGLALSVGLAGLPSLGQAGFMGIGAVAAALVLVHVTSSAFVATVAGVAAASVAGVVAGAAVVRLRPLFVAVSTWLLTWLVALALAAFPGLSGGAQGLVLPPGPGTTTHYELALVLLALAVAAFALLARSPVGVQLAALRERAPAAAALGVAAGRLRLGAFVASAAVGGLAGALAVQLAGVADPSTNGPFTSFELFVAVLIGGAAIAGGGLVGVVVLGLLGLAADAVARLEHVPPERFETMLAAGFLLTVLATGTEGVVPWLRDRLPRHRQGADRLVDGSDPERTPLRTRPPVLAAHGLRKSFGGVVAVDGLSLELQGGRIHALVGPNGSGKTTALRLVSGALQPDDGTVVLDGRPLPSRERERALAGVVRTLQGTAVFPRLTALENAFVGASVRAGDTGPFRAVVATPKARAAHARARAEAAAALGLAGLEDAADEPASRLDAGGTRALMLASALAARPSVLLVDEPAAGASPADVQRLAHVLLRLRERGLALLLVEHDLRLVRRVADWVVVLDAGAVIAAGPPAEVARDPAVRAAYLGRSRL